MTALRKASVAGSTEDPPEVHGDKLECSTAGSQARRRRRVHFFTNSEGPDSVPGVRDLIMVKKVALVPALMEFREWK